MILNWVKRIFCIVTISLKKNYKKRKNLEQELSLQDLDTRKISVQEEKIKIELFPIIWYKIFIPKRIEKKSNNIFHVYKFIKVLTLKELKEERQKREADELKMLEDKVKSLLISIEKAINDRRVEEAKFAFNNIRDKIVKVKDSSIIEKYNKIQVRYSNLVIELEHEKLARLAEEQRRKEEELQKRKEVEEEARKEKKKREREERDRREAEAQRLVDEARRKEYAERAERQRLMSLSSELKEDWQSFKKVLEENNIKYLYHFTDKRNIPSIKKHGGLLSWYYCNTHGITIPCQGGDDESKELDKKYGLEDYVRLSFCDDHPMAYRLKQSGSSIVILKIKVDVALLKHTQFSDMNAADKLHTHGESLDDLQRVNFTATKMHYLRNDDPNFKPHQAEVMVKTFIPLKYIENI